MKEQFELKTIPPQTTFNEQQTNFRQQFADTTFLRSVDAKVAIIRAGKDVVLDGSRKFMAKKIK